MTATLPDWGHIENGTFIPLPRGPLERAGFERAPFEVTLPDGRVRVVVERPETALASDPQDERFAEMFAEPTP